MFRFAAKGLVRWPVTVEQVQANGETEAQRIVVTYQVLDRAALKAREAALRAFAVQMQGLLPKEGMEDLPAMTAKRDEVTDARIAADDALLRERVKGWDGIADEHDVPLPFSTTHLDALIAHPLMRDVLLNGLIEASRGAPSKNSLPGLAGWPVPAQA